MHKKSIFALKISRKLFSHGYESLGNYISEVDSSLTNKWEEFAEKTEREIAALTSEESEEYIDFIYDDIAMIRDVFPQLNGQAQFLNVYAFMEHQLIKVCEQHRKANNIDVSVNDLNGGGIQSSRVYFQKVARFELSDNELWGRLLVFNKVRNLLAHSSGYLSTDNYNYKKIKKFISLNPTFIEFKSLGSGAKSNGDIVIKSECVAQFKADVGSYFEEIYSCWESAASWA